MLCFKKKKSCWDWLMILLMPVSYRKKIISNHVRTKQNLQMICQTYRSLVPPVQSSASTVNHVNKGFVPSFFFFSFVNDATICLMSLSNNSDKTLLVPVLLFSDRQAFNVQSNLCCLTLLLLNKSNCFLKNTPVSVCAVIERTRLMFWCVMLM